jgi:hypothetical protein
MMFRIWFKDGSSVAETAGGYNLFTKDELPKIAAQFGFCATELLQKGEVNMHHEFGEIIGGVIEVYGLEN